MTIPLSGSAGSGSVRIRGTRVGGVWQYDLIRFTDERGNSIDLQADEDSSL